MPGALELQTAYIDFQANNDNVFVVAPNNGPLPAGCPNGYVLACDFSSSFGLTYPFTTTEQLGHCQLEYGEYDIVVIGEDYRLVALTVNDYITSDDFGYLYQTGQMAGEVNIIGSIENIYIEDGSSHTVDLTTVFEPEAGLNCTYNGFSTNQNAATVTMSGTDLTVHSGNESDYFTVVASCEVAGSGTSYALGFGYGNNDPEWMIYNQFTTGFEFGGTHAIDMDSNGKIGFPVRGHGIVFYDDDTGFDVVVPDIPVLVFTNFFIDSNDAAWVCAGPMGLIRIEDGVVTDIFNSSNSLIRYGGYGGITEMDNGDIYILDINTTIWQLQLIKYDGVEFTLLDLPPVLAFDYVAMIFSDGENFWITSNSGLHEYNIENSEWNLYDTSNTIFPENIIGRFVEAENGDLWISSGYSEEIDFLWIARKQVGGEWMVIQHPPLPPHISGYSPYTYDLEVHSSGDVWVAVANSGAHVYHPDTCTWDIFDPDNTPMEDNRTTSFVEQADQSMWVMALQTCVGLYSGDYTGINNDDIPNAGYTLQNYPNPFNPTTTISYSIPFEEKVKISVYNIKGQKVKTLVNEKQIAGNHTIVWNGKDSANKSVSSGVYFYQLQTKHKTKVHKMMLIK